MTISDETLEVIERRKATAALNSNIGLVEDLCKICVGESHSDNVKLALGMLTSQAQMVQTLCNDIDLLLFEIKRLVKLVDIYKELEKVAAQS